MAEFFGGTDHQPFVLGSSDRKVLLVHGFPGTPAEVRGLGRELATAGWEAHGLLLPGFGPAIGTLSDYSWQDWLAATVATLATLRAQATTLAVIGYSMGGALALLAALKARPPVNRLALIAPFSSLADRRSLALPVAQHVIRHVRPFERADFSDPGLRARLASMLPGADLDDFELQARVRREVAIPLKAVEQLRQVGNAALRRSPTLTVPTLVIQGRHDATVTYRSTRKLVSRLGGTVSYHELDADHDVVKPGYAAHSALLQHALAYLE